MGAGGKELDVESQEERGGTECQDLEEKTGRGVMGKTELLMVMRMRRTSEWVGVEGDEWTRRQTPDPGDEGRGEGRDEGARTTRHPPL
jgi:hypothetical protein